RLGKIRLHPRHGGPSSQSWPACRGAAAPLVRALAMQDRIIDAAIPVPGPQCPPFVLLDDARVEGAVSARLFREPVEILVARTAADIPALLDALEAAQARGFHAAGYLAYEAG